MFKRKIYYKTFKNTNYHGVKNIIFTDEYLFRLMSVKGNKTYTKILTVNLPANLTFAQ